MNWSRQIYVVGFATPEDDGPAFGSAGFEWRIYRDEAEQFRAGALTIHGDIVTPVREVTVPDDVPYQEVTAWLNANPEQWEPPRLVGTHAALVANVSERQFSDTDMETILDALNVRALDRQMDEYGDGPGDAAADLYINLTGYDPHEARSLEASV